MHTFTRAAFVALAIACAAPAQTECPILLNRPSMAGVSRWPVSFGIPFRQGQCRDPGMLRIVDETGSVQPAQFVPAADWPDGSLRWVLAGFSADFARRYVLRVSAEAPSAVARGDDLRVSEADGAVSVETGLAQYTFPAGAGCFDTILLDLDANGQFQESEALVDGASSAFYAIDSLGRRAVLRGRELRVVQRGPRHAVIRVEGDYRTADQVRVASGVVYFHFYAGYAQVRISHKFIVTENTNDLWFRDIGGVFPTAVGAGAEALLNSAHARLSETFRARIDAGARVCMVQHDFPHFGSRSSRFSIFEESDAGRRELRGGEACGNWAALASPRWGLAAQLPGFAEQFPKAFRIGDDRLVVKFWADESGQELDFRTRQVVERYLGHDWIPADHPLLDIPNTAHGTAKTHELWLYPLAGALAADPAPAMGATREDIYACIDPRWAAASGVFGPLHPADPETFGRTEAAVADYFERSVAAVKRVFPTHGYLYDGVYPFSAQPWEQKAEHGNRWYPKIHRLSHAMDYNMRRSIWQLFARSGERKYFDFARRYTRFMHDFIFSNTDTPVKPLGWFVQGEWHSPIVWGHFGDGKVPPGYKAQAYDGERVALTLASSADIAQFVYDYFLTGDLHSRDMAVQWKDAMIEEMQFDVDKALALFRPDCFIRMLSAAYELDHDSRLLEYGRAIVRRIVPEEGPEILRPMAETGARINYGKAGEIFAAFYYDWVATGDPLVKDALVRLARFAYTQNRMDQFFSRGSPLLQAFALAYDSTREAPFGAYLVQMTADFGRNWTTLEEEGIEPSALGRHTQGYFGMMTLVGQAPINVGIPVAMHAASGYDGPRLHLPVALKTHPTQKTFLFLRKEAGTPVMLDVYVNNWGHALHRAVLRDETGAERELTILRRDFKHVTEPECYDQNSIWVHRYADHIFLKLLVPAALPAGVYELDLGDEVDFTVLYAEPDRILQAAPDGLVLSRGHPYFFPLPEGAQHVECFAHRPVRIRDPNGGVVAQEALGEGRFRFATASAGAGPWTVETIDDDLTTGPAATDTFFRLLAIAGRETLQNPLLAVALGDPERLFAFDAARARPASARMPAVGEFDPSRPYSGHSVTGGFRQALHVVNRFVELPLPADEPQTGAARSQALDFPRTQGTVEFWFRPLWSVTDLPVARSTQRVQFYAAAPVSISYWVDPDNAGRTGRYNLVKLLVQLEGAGATQANVFLHEGKWYHVAVTWNVDGAANVAHIFINGRRKAYSNYKPLLDSEASPEALPAAASLRLGAGDWAGHRLASGLFDELRVSSGIRYRESFAPPSAPFSPDDETVVLMHFDGDLSAMLYGRQEAATLKAGRLW